MSATDKQIGGDHYQGDIQPIDFMRAVMSPEQFEGYCRGNALKYLSRVGKKGDKREQIEKAMHYLEFWLESLG